MNKKLIGLIMILVIASLALSACERPATRAPGGAATPTSEIPFPVATQPQIMVDILKGTQTAAALTPQTGGGIAATSTPSFAFSTPAAGTPAAATSAPVVASTPYPASTPGKPASYTLLHGEFPYCIARRFNVNPVDLLSMNGLNMDSFPATGAKLNIPTSGSFPGERALKAHPTTYTVRASETIGMVACYFGDVDPNIIYSANGIAAGTALTTGQVLQIP